eukprot:8018163-Pyramimonas_sp.AAC.1
MGTNTNTGGFLHKGKMILDFGVGGNIWATLETKILPPSPGSGTFFPRCMHTDEIGVGVNL